MSKRSSNKRFIERKIASDIDILQSAKMKYMEKEMTEKTVSSGKLFG